MARGQLRISLSVVGEPFTFKEVAIKEAKVSAKKQPVKADEEPQNDQQKSAKSRERNQRNYQRRIRESRCVQCGQRLGDDARGVRCKTCAEKLYARNHARRERLIKERRCVQCGKLIGKGGTKTLCKDHNEISGARILEMRARRREAGLCEKCGKRRGDKGTANYCRECADKQKVITGAWAEQQFKDGKCPWHKCSTRMLKHCPACIYEESEANDSGFSFTFKGLLPPPASGDRLEVCVGCENCGRKYDKGGSFKLPRFPVGLKLRDVHVGEKGAGLWLLFSKEDEKGVPVEFEVCSLPDDKCKGVISRPAAFDHMRRYLLGKRVSGACQKHVHDRGRLSEAVAARLRQQLDQAQAQNGSEQKNGSAEKRKTGPEKGLCTSRKSSGAPPR